MPVVDVRDVAFAHLQAVKVAEAANTRFILADYIWMEDLGIWLHEKYSPVYDVAHARMGKWLAWIAKWFVKDVRTLYSIWGVKMTIENSKSEEVLGFKFRDFKTATLDMAESLIDLGYIPDKRK